MKINYSVPRHKRHKKIMKKARGFFGCRSGHFRNAKESVLHAMEHITVSRKVIKREMRRNWISRINIFARSELNSTYSVVKRIFNDFDRKNLAQVMFEEPEVIKTLFQQRSAIC